MNCVPSGQKSIIVYRIRPETLLDVVRRPSWPQEPTRVPKVIVIVLFLVMVIVTRIVMVMFIVIIIVIVLVEF